MKKTLCCLVFLTALLLALTGCWGESSPAPRPSPWPTATPWATPLPSYWPDDAPTATPNSNNLPKTAWR